MQRFDSAAFRTHIFSLSQTDGAIIMDNRDNSFEMLNIHTNQFVRCRIAETTGR